MANKRVVFTFDEQSYDTLQELAKKYGSMADAVRESLRNNDTLQKQKDQGFKEVVLRNPTDKSVERVWEPR